MQRSIPKIGFVFVLIIGWMAVAKAESSLHQRKTLEAIVAAGCQEFLLSEIHKKCIDKSTEFDAPLTNADVQMFAKNKAGLIQKICTFPDEKTYGPNWRFARIKCYYNTINASLDPALTDIYNGDYDKAVFGGRHLDVNFKAQKSFLDYLNSDLKDYADPKK